MQDVEFSHSQRTLIIAVAALFCASTVVWILNSFGKLLHCQNLLILLLAGLYKAWRNATRKTVPAQTKKAKVCARGVFVVWCMC